LATRELYGLIRPAVSMDGMGEEMMEGDEGRSE
jgi:hypothetical protein